MAKLPAGSSKKNYVTDKKTGKPLYMDTKNPQEAGVGSVGKAAIKLGFKAIEKIANTKPGVKATKAVAKKVQTQAVKGNKKTVEKIANMQEKTKAPPMGKKDIKKMEKFVDKLVKNEKKTVKADAKASARGLKAANKPVKNKDADLINRNNPYARSAILSEKPARANRTRLGKDAFKSK
jgi:hypothetical protein